MPGLRSETEPTSLRQLLNIERIGDLWSMPINPTSDPFSEPFEVDLDAAIATALWPSGPSSSRAFWSCRTESSTCAISATNNVPGSTST